MMKKTLILIGLFVWSIGAIAQDATQRLVVWQKSGEKVYFDLAEEPETTFEGTQLVIKTSKERSYIRARSSSVRAATRWPLKAWLTAPVLTSMLSTAAY